MAAPSERPPIRLTYVTADYPSPPGHAGPRTGTGGAEIQAHRVARSLESKVEVSVLTRKVPGLGSHDEFDGVRVDRLKLRCAGTAGSILDAMTLALEGLRAERPDIVQGFQLNGVTFGGAGFALARRAPYVVKIAGRSNLDSVRSPLGARKLALLTRLTTTFVAVNETMRDELAEVGIPPGKITIIPNAVDTAQFVPADESQRQEARARLGLGAAETVFCWIGRFDPQKGVDLLREVWPEFAAARPDARLIIAGGGPQQPLVDELVRQSNGTVQCVGVVSDVGSIYWASDFNLLTSPREGLSGVLLEAAACGVGSVVPNVRENLDVDPDGEFLIGYERSAGGLLAAMNDASQSGDHARRADRARNRVISVYSLTETSRRWLDLYETLISRSGRR